MFRCQHCNSVTPPHVSAETIVVETRPYVYPFREKAFPYEDKSHRRRKHIKRNDPGGTGSAIVREIRVCPPCKLALQPDLTTPTP
jgi:hypothetical protein